MKFECYQGGGSRKRYAFHRIFRLSAIPLRLSFAMNVLILRLSFEPFLFSVMIILAKGSEAGPLVITTCRFSSLLSIPDLLSISIVNIV